MCFIVPACSFRLKKILIPTHYSFPLCRSCYRVGMNLRSSVVSAIYNKALVISVASLSRKTLGEITNLMSVDSTRLQVMC